MPERRFGPYRAFLFDMDGTVLLSRVAIERVWAKWSERWGLDPAAVCAFLHGRRATDAIDHFVPGLDPARRSAEIDWVETREMEDTEGITEVAGARALLSTLPPDRWAIVTSAARRLAACRLRAAGLPDPLTLIAAEDVAMGKPDPAGYLRAAALMGCNVGECLVFEDAPAGLQAAFAAGVDVIAVGSDPDSESFPVRERIPDYARVSSGVTPHGMLYFRKHDGFDAPLR